ncbi:MAG: aminoacyl-tRNA hydrolase [Roseibacillus sp.]
MADIPQLVVGLGNPGKEYVGTRHNVGFEILERVVTAAGLAFRPEKKWRAEMCRTAEGLLFLKPQTYMNLSGRAVAAVSRFYKIAPESILVVYDDVALPLGQHRFRLNGSAGGHNGIQSLLSDLGSQSFPRLKVGIGGVPGARLSGHVLGRFGPDEREAAEKALATAVDAVQFALAEGIGKAANRFNSRPKAQNPKPDSKSQPKKTDDGQEIRRPDCSEHEREGR